MTIRHLEIFMEVCRTGSMTEAAGNLGMTQPAVSLAIRELEVYYHVKLFDRANRRIYLTDAGEKLQQYARSILSQMKEAEDVMRDGTAFGICRMAVNVSTAETYLPGFLHLPDRERMHVSICDSHHAARMIIRNEADLGIVDTVEEDSPLSVTPLYREPMTAVASDLYTEKRRLKKEEPMRFLLREKGSGNRRCTDAELERTGIHAEPWIQSTSDLSLIRLAIQGYGITVLPRSLLEEYLEDGSLHEVQIADTSFIRNYYLIRMPGKYMSLAVQETIDRIREYFTVISQRAQI